MKRYLVAALAIFCVSSAHAETIGSCKSTMLRGKWLVLPQMCPVDVGGAGKISGFQVINCIVPPSTVAPNPNRTVEIKGKLATDAACKVTADIKTKSLTYLASVGYVATDANCTYTGYFSTDRSRITGVVSCSQKTDIRGTISETGIAEPLEFVRAN